MVQWVFFKKAFLKSQMSCLFQYSWNEPENCIVDIVKYVGEQSSRPLESKMRFKRPFEFSMHL